MIFKSHDFKSHQKEPTIWLQALLLIAFVLPSLVPTGYMVQRNPETSLVEVTICSGVNHRRAWLDVDTGEYLASGEVVADDQTLIETVEADLCPFAVSSVASAPVLYLPELIGIVSTEFNDPVYVHRGQLIQLLPPVRGPPVLS